LGHAKITINELAKIVLDEFSKEKNPGKFKTKYLLKDLWK